MERGTLALGAAGLMLPAFFLWDFLLGQSFLFFYDIEGQWIPLHRFFADSLKAGDTIAWNPYSALGNPQLAESQLGAFYPPKLLYLFFDDTARAISVVLYLHLALAFGATAWLARAAGQGSAAAGLAGIAFAFSGFMTAQVTNLNIVLAAAWFPVLLGAALRIHQGGHPGWWALLSLCVALQLLVSHGQTTFIALLATAIFFATLRAAEVGCGRVWLRDGAFLALAVLGGVGLAAVQVLPALELQRLSIRADGIPREVMTANAVTWFRLLALVFPTLHGNNRVGRFDGEPGDRGLSEDTHVYLGVIPLLLAAGALWGSWRLPVWRAVAVMGGVGVLLGLGKAIPYVALADLPGFNWFRSPGRWSLVATLALALLAGRGLEAGLSARRWLLLAVALPAALLAVALVDGPWSPGSLAKHLLHGAPARAAAANPLDALLLAAGRLPPLLYYAVFALAGAALCVLRPRRAGAGVAVGFAALGFADLSIVESPHNPRGAASVATAAQPHLERLAARIGAARVLSVPRSRAEATPGSASALLQGYTGAAFRIPTQSIFVSIPVARYARLMPLSHTVALYAGFEYELRQRPAGDIAVTRFPRAFPRAFTVSRVRALASEEVASEALRRADYATLRREAIVLSREYAELVRRQAAAAGLARAAARPLEAAAITAYGNGRVAIEASTPGPRLLVLTDIHYPGWEATVDGEPAPILLVGGAFRGVFLDAAGPHRVVMNFRSGAIRTGAWISVAVAGLAVVGAGIGFRRRCRGRISALPAPAAVRQSGSA